MLTIKDKKLLLVITTVIIYFLIILLLVYVMIIFGDRYRDIYYNVNLADQKLKVIDNKIGNKDKILKLLHKSYDNKYSSLYSVVDKKSIENILSTFQNHKVISIKKREDKKQNLIITYVKVDVVVKDPYIINNFIKRIESDISNVMINFPLKMKYNDKTNNIAVKLNLTIYNKVLKH